MIVNVDVEMRVSLGVFQSENNLLKKTNKGKKIKDVPSTRALPVHTDNTHTFYIQ